VKSTRIPCNVLIVGSGLPDEMYVTQRAGLFKWPNASAVKKSYVKRRIVVGYVTNGFVMIVP
jgi:hypothetical protein